MQADDPLSACRAFLATMPPEAFGNAAEHFLVTAKPAVLANPTLRGDPMRWLRSGPSVPAPYLDPPDFVPDPKAITQHVERASIDALAFDAMGHLAAVLLHKGIDLPDALHRFAAQALSGQRKRPKRGGRLTDRENPPGDRLRIWSAVQFVHARFGLPVYAGRTSAALSACRVVHLALGRSPLAGCAAVEDAHKKQAKLIRQEIKRRSATR